MINLLFPDDQFSHSEMSCTQLIVRNGGIGINRMDCNDSDLGLRATIIKFNIFNLIKHVLKKSNEIVT